MEIGTLNIGGCVNRIYDMSLAGSNHVVSIDYANYEPTGLAGGVSEVFYLQHDSPISIRNVIITGSVAVDYVYKLFYECGRYELGKPRALGGATISSNVITIDSELIAPVTYHGSISDIDWATGVTSDEGFIHCNIKTRRKWIPAGEIYSDGSGAALTSYNAGGNFISGWTLDSATSEYIGSTIKMPDDWVEGSNVKLYIALMPTTATGGNIVCTAYWKFLTNGEVATNSADGYKYFNGLSMPTTQYEIKIVDFGIMGGGLVSGNLIRLSFFRKGSDSGDTYADDVVVLGCYIEYEAFD